MTKKELCLAYTTKKYGTMFGGVELKHIDYTQEPPIVYYVSHERPGRPTYHTTKLYEHECVSPYFIVYGMRVRPDKDLLNVDKFSYRKRKEWEEYFNGKR